jgi:nucleoside-diphosphate-sugar epimerase
VRETDPDAIVHQATALADLRDFKHFDRSFAQTNRLRTEGTETLLAAARESGVGRFFAQSYASMRYERVGGALKSEDDPLDPAPVAATRAKRELGWELRYPSWRQGFAAAYASINREAHPVSQGAKPGPLAT